MATATRFPTTTTGADVDVLAGISIDRIHLRFGFAFVPVKYEYEADGTTHKLNAAQEKVVTPVGGGYTFWPTLATVFGMQTDAMAAVAGGATIDAAQVAAAEALQQAALAAWDQMVSDYETAVAAYDPEAEAPVEPVIPTVQDVADAVGCAQITGDHPFTLD